MKKIICKNGEEILVDDEDYHWLSRHKWFVTSGKHNDSYAYTTLNNIHGVNKNISMHAMIMGCCTHTDHIDGNKWNNQKHNLREATKVENGWNRRKQRDSEKKQCTSKYKGVSRYVNARGHVWWNVS